MHEYTEASQDIYEGVSNGYKELDVVRLRYFGGSTNHWAGYCRTPQPSDFAGRPWVPDSGWPIRIDALLRHMPEAASIVGIDPRFKAKDWTTRTATRLPEFETPGLERRVSVIGGPVRFGETFLDEIAAARDIECYLDANLTRIVPTPDGRHIDHIEVRGIGSLHPVRVNAKIYVLAAGGIETPRLLLNSDDIVTGGIGNSSGAVGRYFADHRASEVGTVVAARGALGMFGTMHRVEGNGGMTIVPDLVLTADAAREAQCARCILRLKSTTATGAFDRATEFVKRLLPWDSAVEEFAIMGFSEPVPVPENRVTLMPERDRLGLRRARLDYRPSEMEAASVQVGVRLLARSLGAASAGRINVGPDGEDDAQVSFGSHHYGTTRMHHDPARGVVNTDLRLHDVDNMYVCSTSVYPTAGLMTPTMTLVALTLRLAETLNTALSET